MNFQSNVQQNCLTLHIKGHTPVRIGALSAVKNISWIILIALWVVTRFTQCCGSVTFWYGSGSAQWLTRWQKKIFFVIFCLLLFEGTFTSVFIDKKSTTSHKVEEIKNFLTFFACSWKDPDPDPYKISGSRRTNNIRIRIHNSLEPLVFFICMLSGQEERIGIRNVKGTNNHFFPRTKLRCPGSSSQTMGFSWLQDTSCHFTPGNKPRIRKSIIHWLINYIDSKAKCHPKNWPVKGLGSRVNQSL